MHPELYLTEYRRREHELEVAAQHRLARTERPEATAPRRRRALRKHAR